MLNQLGNGVDFNSAHAQQIHAVCISGKGAPVDFFNATKMHNGGMDLPPTHQKMIGLRVKQTRLALGELNAAAFARSAGITAQLLNNWERGIGRPAIDHAYKFVTRTGVTLDWLYRGVTTGLGAEMLKKLSAAELLLEDSHLSAQEDREPRDTPADHRGSSGRKRARA